MKLKWFILALLWLGFGWTAYVAFGPTDGPNLCLFRAATGYPCPACGSTRALAHLFHGHLWESLLVNPFGLLVLLLGIPAFLLLMADALTGTRRFEQTLGHIDRIARSKPWIWALLITLVLANCIWNLLKWNYG